MSELREKIRKWKEVMEKKGIKVNAGKTKVMFGGERRVIEEFVARPKWPCATCGKRVGANSVNAQSASCGYMESVVEYKKLTGVNSEV